MIFLWILLSRVLTWIAAWSTKTSRLIAEEHPSDWDLWETEQGIIPLGLYRSRKHHPTNQGQRPHSTPRGRR